MNCSLEKIDLDYLRRFGAEIEINAFDLRNRPIGHGEGKLPEGTYYVANLVQKSSNKIVKIHKWSYDHNNTSWIIKPDSSCGIEICTPVLKGWLGICETGRVINALKQDAKITADERCSFHVHIDVSDLNETEVAAIATWWIKCESVFMDSMPIHRKKNQYCQLIGHSEILGSVESGFLSNDAIIRKLGYCKYFTINTYHYHNNKRKTIEFRIMDNECCRDPRAAKNWIRLILHFVERALIKGMPDNYISGDRWSGYCWLDPVDVFEFLGFSENFDLSKGAQQVRNWFIERLFDNVKNNVSYGVMGTLARQIAAQEIEFLFDTFEPQAESTHNLFDKKFRI